MEIRLSIYRLPQEGALVNTDLKVNLAPHGYFETPHIPGLWRHIPIPISFDLIVDIFGVRYIDKVDTDHLIAALKKTP